MTKSDIIKALTEIASNNRIQFSLPQTTNTGNKKSIRPKYILLYVHNTRFSCSKGYSIIDPLSAKPTSKYGIDNHTILKKITLPELYILITEYPKAEDMGNIRRNGNRRKY